MSTVAVHPFRGCELWIWPADRYLESRWESGERCGATRECEMNNLSYARHIGYADCWTAVAAHEAAHHFTMERLGYPYSPTLWAVANDCGPGTAPYEFRIWEESVVLSFERWFNLNEWTASLGHPEIRFRLARWREEWEQVRGEILMKARAA